MVSRLDTCAALHYWTRQQWCPLPEWAHFFIRLGWDLQHIGAEHERAVVAVSVPHRGFAASFAALGALLAEPLPQPTSDDVRQHFAHLLTLPDPVQTPTGLTYIHDGRKVRGLFAGTQTQGNTRFVKVCVQSKAAYKSGGLTHYVREEDAIRLQIDPEAQPRLGRHVSGRALASHGDFVRHFYTQDDLHRLHLAARCHVMIIGRVNALREETTQVRCAIHLPNKTFDEGVLNDVLRIRKFITDATKARVAIHPILRDAVPQPEDRASARLVIFDGADAFAKWAGCFASNSMLVVLDRAETQFDEGLSQVNTRYLSRFGDYSWQAGVRIPAGIDATGFLEVRR